MKWLYQMFLCALAVSFMAMTIVSSPYFQKKGLPVNIFAAAEDWNEESSDEAGSSEETDIEFTLCSSFQLIFNPILNSRIQVSDSVIPDSHHKEILLPPPQA